MASLTGWEHSGRRMIFNQTKEYHTIISFPRVSVGGKDKRKGYTQSLLILMQPLNLPVHPEGGEIKFDYLLFIVKQLRYHKGQHT